MHLKEATAKNKLDQFDRERNHFYAVLKSMVSGTAKAKSRKSKKRSRAD